jgi:hypothetical protein
MNKLLFREGGQPFYLDDLDFMQSAFADTVKGIVSTYGNVILSGCNVPPPISIAGRPTTYNWEEGYIAINGEVYRVEEGSFEGGLNANLYWKVVSTEGQKEIYENTSENNVYQYRKVELTDTVEAADIYVAAQGMKTVEELTSNIRILEIKDTTESSQNAVLRLYPADISLIEPGDIVEIILSVGMESTSSVGGATPNNESFKFLIDNSTTTITSGAKPVAWVKTIDDYAIAWVYVNFSRTKGEFYVANKSSGKLYLGSLSSHRVIVYKKTKNKW